MQILKGQYWGNNYFCLFFFLSANEVSWPCRDSDSLKSVERNKRTKKKRDIYGIPDADPAPRWGMTAAERRHESVKRAAEGLRYKAERI